MLGFGRGERWWIRELEKRERAHEAERARLVATICDLAGKPQPDPWVVAARTETDEPAGDPLEEV